MAACRHVTGAFVLLASIGSAQAQTYSLVEANKAGDCFRLKLEMKLQGEMRINRDGRVVPMKLQAQAEHGFWERTIGVGKDGLPDKVCRSYDRARIGIDVAGDHSERALRSERSLIVAQKAKDQLTVFSPAGPLLREELDLVGEHLDTLALCGLLPVQPVAVGATWKVSNTVAQFLCAFEGITGQSIECKLAEVTNGLARVQISGAGTGIELGALVKLKIQGELQFDLQSKRIVGAEWKQHDERDQGPASPASSVDSTTSISRAAVEQPTSLSDVAIVSVPDGFETPPYLLQLEFHDARARYDMVAAREWQTVSRTDEHVVMRLMERGEFVAQVTITPWTKAEKGKHLTPEEFRKAMEETPGWQVEEEVQAAEVPADNGRWIYRISALGQLDGAKVMQNFYLVAGPNGDQAVLAFTLTPKQADRVAARDLSLAASLYFPAAKAAADKP